MLKTITAAIVLSAVAISAQAATIKCSWDYAPSNIKHLTINTNGNKSTLSISGRRTVNINISYGYFNFKTPFNGTAKVEMKGSNSYMYLDTHTTKGNCKSVNSYVAPKKPSTVYTPSNTNTSFMNILGADNWGWSVGKRTLVHSTYGFRVTKDNKGQHSIEIDKAVDEALYNQIKVWLPKVTRLNKYATDVFLNSNGGNAYYGIQIGQLLREYGTRTIVTKGQVCASACADIFIGGNHRDIRNSGYVWVHAPFLTNDDGSIECPSQHHEDAQFFTQYAVSMLGASDARAYNNASFRLCSETQGVSIYNNTVWIES